MKSLKEQAGRVIEICKPRNLFLFSTLAVGSVFVAKNVAALDSPTRFSNSQSIGVHREGNVINASAPSPYKVDDMVFLFQGGPAYYTDKKKPNLTGGLGVDGQTVHITKIGEANVGPVDFEAFFSTLWSNKWTAVEIIAGSLLAWSLLAPYSKGAKKTVSDKLVKEAERLKKYILEDTGPFGANLTAQLQEKAMNALDGEVHGGTMFPESKDIINAKNYEQWKQWRVSGVPAGTPSAEVAYYNTLAPRLENALTTKVTALKQAVVDQMAANLIESLPKYGATKKMMTDAKNFKFNEEVQTALQTSLDENNVKIDLNEVNRQEVLRPKPRPYTGPSTSTDIIQVKPGAIIKSEYTTDVIESKPYGEFLDGLATRCNSIKKTLSTFINEKTPLWGAVKADFASEAKITTKLGKPLLLVGSLLLLGYGISSLDKVWIDYKNRVAANEAAAYVALQNANADKAKKEGTGQAAETINPVSYIPAFNTAKYAEYGSTAGSHHLYNSPFTSKYGSFSPSHDATQTWESDFIAPKKGSGINIGMSLQPIDPVTLKASGGKAEPKFPAFLFFGEKGKSYAAYSMFDDTFTGDYVEGARYHVSTWISPGSWGFALYKDGKQVARNDVIPLPADWSTLDLTKFSMCLSIRTPSDKPL